MRSRAFRFTAAVLCILMCAGTPVLAGPVVVSQVVQVLGVNQNPVSLRLQNTHQKSDAVSSGVRGSQIEGPAQGSDSFVGTSDTSDTLLSGVSVIQGQDVGVETLDQDDVEGTICDCGEILVAGAAFTAWPLFFIGAVPLFFINDNPPETPTPTPTPPEPTPTPTPPPQPVPEPATLLLLGTGLAAIGASLRRRRVKLQPKSEELTERD